MANQAKLLRSQLRQVVKELLPDLLKEQLFDQATKQIQERLTQIHNEVRANINRIDERQKDVQHMIMQEFASKDLPKPSLPVEDTK